MKKKKKNTVLVATEKKPIPIYVVLMLVIVVFGNILYKWLVNFSIVYVSDGRRVLIVMSEEYND